MSPSSVQRLPATRQPSVKPLSSEEDKPRLPIAQTRPSYQADRANFHGYEKGPSSGVGPGTEDPSRIVYAVIAGLVRRSLRPGLRPALLGLGPGRELPALFIQSGTITARMSSCIVIPRSFAIFLSWA